MATIRYEGNEVELAEDWRIGELIRAENALGIDMDEAKGGAKLALVVFISLYRPELGKDPSLRKPVSMVADEIMNMELTGLITEEEEPEVPLEDEPGEGESEEKEEEASAKLPTTGALRSVSSGQ